MKKIILIIIMSIFMLVGFSQRLLKSYDSEDIKLDVFTTKIRSGPFFEVDVIRINFINKSNSVIRIIWDECAITDKNGNVSSIIYEGFPYKEINNPQVPAVILPFNQMSRIIIPKTHVYFYEGVSSGWRVNSITQGVLTKQLLITYEIRDQKKNIILDLFLNRGDLENEEYLERQFEVEQLKRVNERNQEKTDVPPASVWLFLGTTVFVVIALLINEFLEF